MGEAQKLETYKVGNGFSQQGDDIGDTSVLNEHRFPARESTRKWRMKFAAGERETYVTETKQGKSHMSGNKHKGGKRWTLQQQETQARPNNHQVQGHRREETSSCASS